MPRKPRPRDYSWSLSKVDIPDEIDKWMEDYEKYGMFTIDRTGEFKNQSNMSFRRIMSGPFRDAYSMDVSSAITEEMPRDEIERRIIDHLYNSSHGSPHMAAHHLRTGDAIPVIVHSMVKMHPGIPSPPRYKEYTLEEARKLVAKLEKEALEKESKKPITKTQKLLL